MPDHTVALVLDFKGLSRLLSTVAVPAPASRVSLQQTLQSLPLRGRHLRFRPGLSKDQMWDQLRSAGCGSPSTLPVPWPARPEPVAWRRGEGWPVAGEARSGKTVPQPRLALTCVFQPVFEFSFCLKINGKTTDA